MTDAAPTDAAPTDAAPTDAAPTDAAPTDAAQIDGDLTDGEVADAAIPDAQPIDPSTCDPAEIFQRNDCTNCHGAASLGGLDLRSQDFARLMADAPAQAEGCQNRKLLDVDRPEHSLILQVVGATEPPAGDEDSCQLVMPPLPSGILPEADRTCLTQWVDDVAEEYRGDPSEVPEPVIDTLRSSLQKIKTLLRGDAVTAGEYAQVVNAADEGCDQHIGGMMDHGFSFRSNNDGVFEGCTSARAAKL